MQVTKLMHKTLIILTPGFPHDEHDTTCLPDRQIFVRVLKEMYPELNIIVLSFQYPYRAAAYNWHNVKVVPLNGRNKSGLHRRLIWARALGKLKKIYNEHKVIGLLSFWLDECAFIGDKFAKKYKLKHYAWLLGQDARPGNNYVNRVKPQADSLIALSDFIIDEFWRNYQIKPMHLVPGAIDPGLFAKQPDEKDIDIIAAGSLISLKRYDMLIDVIAGLKKDNPKIKAVLCGSGPAQQMLQQKITDHGLTDNLMLMGGLPHAQVLALMQRSKVFLHPSSYEGFGIVCLEALYAGCKVISFVKPMNQAIRNWHIADNPQDMQQMAALILGDDTVNYQPVLPFTMVDSVKAIINLY